MYLPVRRRPYSGFVSALDLQQQLRIAASASTNSATPIVLRLHRATPIRVCPIRVCSAERQSCISPLATSNAFTLHHGYSRFRVDRGIIAHQGHRLHHARNQFHQALWVAAAGCESMRHSTVCSSPVHTCCALAHWCSSGLCGW